LQNASIWFFLATIFSPPHIFTAKGIALRAFADMIDNPQTTISKHPQDFSLALIGEFNETTGQFYPQFPPVFVATGLDFKPAAATPTLNVVAGGHE